MSYINMPELIDMLENKYNVKVFDKNDNYNPFYIVLLDIQEKVFRHPHVSKEDKDILIKMMIGEK